MLARANARLLKSVSLVWMRCVAGVGVLKMHVFTLCVCGCVWLCVRAQHST